MACNRAPKPDNMPTEFYIHCWGFVKNGIMHLFEAFHSNSLDVALNYGVSTLIPKMNGAKKNQQYRPICLLRCPYKLKVRYID